MSASNPPGSHDCGGDAAAYVLGALDPAEAAAFEEHLAACAVCQDEIEALRGVVQALPMAATQYPAPRRLRRRIMGSIREEQAAARHTRRPSPGLRWTPRVRVAGGLLSACAAAAAAIVLFGSTGGVTGRLIRAQVSSLAGTAQLRVAGDHGELIVHHLTAPGPGHVYEVWLKAAHQNPVPASVLFGVSQTGDADVGLPRSLRGVSQVLVTSEPDGGTAIPTSRPVIVAQLS